MTAFAESPADILARLAELRAADAPTHGGHVLSYVYDSGLAELDELAGVRDPRRAAGQRSRSHDLHLGRRARARGRRVRARTAARRRATSSASVTTGGTESCLLAVKTARDLWRAQHPDAVGRPRLLAPVTVHAAFQKAAHYFDLDLDLVPVAAGRRGRRRARSSIALGDDVALVVVSAPSYPFAALDPVDEVAAACAERGIALHVDACIGGLVLPFWHASDGSELPAWDFRVPGVTSVSADLHKFGYAPKGASVLLQRGRDRQRAQFFATTRWPGYPVVNPTILGSKSAGPLAAAWAITRALGRDGFAELAASCERATRSLIEAIDGDRGPAGRRRAGRAAARGRDR